MKYLLLVLAIVALVWLIRGARRHGVPPAKSPRDAGVQPMVACQHCGVHLPKSDALMDAGGRPFCSEAHRLAGPR